MPKTVKVSLSAIVKSIDEALKKLEKGKSLAVSSKEKKAILVKIKKIEKAKKELRSGCTHGGHSMTIIVPGSN